MDEQRADRLKRAVRKIARAEAAVRRAVDERDALLREFRAAGERPAEMARIVGLTREWVTKIAPDPTGAHPVPGRSAKDAPESA